MNTLVECHSGYEYPQRPKTVFWQNRKQPVHTVITEWKKPNGKGFRVLLGNGTVLDLIYNIDLGEWTILTP